MVVAARCMVCLAAGLAVACADQNAPDVPAALTIVAGDGQIDTIDGALVESVAVRVSKASGRGMGLVLVGWSAGSGAVRPETTATDPSGLAKAQWTLGSDLGQEYVTVSLMGAARTLTDSFSATVNAGRATYLRVIPQGDTRMMVGGTLVIMALAHDRLVHTLGHSAIQWASSDPGIATVTDSAPTTPDVSGFGVVHPVGSGSVFITAQSASLRDSAAVVVVRDTAVFGSYDLRQRDSVVYPYCQTPAPNEVLCFSGRLDIDGVGGFVAKRYQVYTLILIGQTLIDSSVTTGTYQVVSPCQMNLLAAAPLEPQGSALKNLDSLVVTSDPAAPPQHRWVYRGSARPQACP